MVVTVVPGEDESSLPAAVEAFCGSQKTCALTGAGISVESGIPDFRSPDGLWSRFPPDEYATIEIFLRDPPKAWQLYRAMGNTLEGKRPNPAHAALARLEKAGRLDLIVTQNVDGLHQAAGSQKVIELHGDHRRLQCIRCGWLGPVEPAHLADGSEVPACPGCSFHLKPNVVLFGEDVRGMEEATEAVVACDTLLVVGTSAQVFPAAGLPAVVKAHDGLIFEFNTEETALTKGTAGANWLSLLLEDSAGPAQTDFLFKGPAARTVDLFAATVLGWNECPRGGQAPL